MKPLIQLRSVCLVVALLLGGLSTQAASRPRYEIVDLGTIPGGGYPAQGTDINNSGQITAIARGSNLFYRACIYENGALRDLGIGTNGSGAQINDAGAMIGSFGTDWDTFTHGRDHAFMITTGGIFTDLSVQFNRYVSPGGINNFGHIVGNAETDDGTSIVPFIYSNGVFQLIPTPEVYFADINDAGQILGTVTQLGPVPGDFAPRAAIYQNGQVTLLARPRHSPESFGTRINEKGQVIGYADDVNHFRRGFVWSKGHTRSVRPLHKDTVTFLYGINNLRVAVGYSRIPDERVRAILWRNGKTHDLNRMIRKNSGWELNSASAINDRGQIVGSGLFDGEYHAFLLNPIKRGHAPGY